MLPIASHYCHPYKYLGLARLPIFEYSTTAKRTIVKIGHFSGKIAKAVLPQSSHARAG